MTLHWVTAKILSSFGRTPVLEKVSKLVWELILDGNGLGKDISETVEKVFCRLSGREPPLFPDQNSEREPEKDTPLKEESKSEKKRGGKEKRDEKEKQSSISKSRKRNIGEMSADGSASELASKTSDPSTVPDESN